MSGWEIRPERSENFVAIREVLVAAFDDEEVARRCGPDPGIGEPAQVG